MKTLVIGAAGMLGKKLVSRLNSTKKLGEAPISSMMLCDVVDLPSPVDRSIPTAIRTGDLAHLNVVRDIIGSLPDVIFHLAAVVSGEAETNLQKGYRVNVDAIRLLLEEISAQPSYQPRVVFSSSIAVFGPPYPESIPDDFYLTPRSSYGHQKAISELYLSDYSRRGFVDAVSLRLPTICVRPGAPNKARTGFFSSIIREPLIGKEAVLPVPTSVRHWFASPRAAIDNIVHAATLDTKALDARRSLNMPGVSATIEEEIEALRTVAGDAAVRLIRKEPDEELIRWGGFAERFDAAAATSLGFVADADFEAIIRRHIDEELGGRVRL